MFRRYVSHSFACAILIFSTAVLVSAQTGQLFGKVVLKQADGKTAPAAGAAVLVYRTDMAGRYETKTNKSGNFIFAGVPFVGDYIVIVSNAGAKPTWIAGVKAGREVDYLVEMTPGDGRTFTARRDKNHFGASQRAGR